MAQKENKGGELTNEQIEQDLKAKGKNDQRGRSYSGSQDTGDTKKREYGSDVQRNDGWAKEGKDTSADTDRDIA
ncbi:MAG: hypothetical protein M3342_24690 [Bacteroidota bacterium]|nr:hypothetical protein [Flavisolibacter sp.]MBD0289348.1 hypothetical protein [Flavisolibacter sp.]MBD0351125.1 hypothetical protein [Flavisolibacter sp.]MBD0365730.1 hypothetical protein [Flavisolibacter sp.]MDQ3847183.1 hypothetical protein [Bacteroidota bacterium]